MIRDVTIRPEEPGDLQIINDLTYAAFAPMTFSDDTEAAAIDAMRKAGDLTHSLVAVTDQIIGHVAISPASISDASGPWFGLGPIAVRADFQRHGIGTLLAHAALAELRKMGAAGCVLTGNPDVYQPMGFAHAVGLTHGNLNPKYILYHALLGTEPTGEVTFAPALQEYCE